MQVNTRTSRTAPLIFILAGGLLLFTAIVLNITFQRHAVAYEVTLPYSIAGFTRTGELSGQAGMDAITQLHGKSFPLKEGKVGYYGSNGEVTLWIAGVDSIESAGKLLELMRTRIAEGNSPFDEVEVRRDGTREVHVLEGMGQRHFYFQSGRYVIWLAAPPDDGEAVLLEILASYP
jgi:hypothetical protein